jgi:hypothetical protein
MQFSTPTSTGSNGAPRGPLAELLCSLPGVQLVAQHAGLAEIDRRFHFRSWTSFTPGVRVLEGRASEGERDRWLQAAIAALGVRDRCYVGVGAGGEWLEIGLGGNALGSRALDLVLETRAVHNPLMPYVDVCLLATERDSVLVVRKTPEQMLALIFHDLREKHRARLRRDEEARRIRLQESRRMLETVRGLVVHDVTAADGDLPSGEALSSQFEHSFDLPHVCCRNEQDPEERARWMRGHLEATVFAAPKSCFLWQGWKSEGPWRRLDLLAREGWAADVLYALAGKRSDDQWARRLHWSRHLMFLSSDATTVMSWETAEHDLFIHINRVDVVLERARSRSRLDAWLATQKNMLAHALDGADVAARDVLSRKQRIATLRAGASRMERDRWLLDCLRHRLCPRYDEHLLPPGQRTQFSGSASLSIGATLLPWTQVFWRDPTWLPRLWDELQPEQLFIQAHHQVGPGPRQERLGPEAPVRVLALRRAARGYEAFLHAAPKRRA